MFDRTGIINILSDFGIHAHTLFRSSQHLSVEPEYMQGAYKETIGPG